MMLKKLQIRRLIKNIELVVFDFDGVFTDNTVIVSQSGLESVKCWRSDGLGLDMLRELNINTVIISGETNDVVLVRANKLKIKCYHGINEKEAVLKSIINEYGCKSEHVAYVGNDINDLSCMKLVGLPVAVGDAYPQVKKQASIVLKRKGGQGAVREFCELIVNVKKNKNLFWGVFKW
ncbi:HAD hydrolase family protein [Caldifermentibacillus hisashii]|uniref:KdsC family phosphatase n=1 Tax=Caldifermentibacillus hisashii TaxID=996558 RepID=UPI0031FD41B1